ncbi:MAG: hypothetical protein ACTHKQ_15865, partial [Mesorhizobium sp.]
MRGLLSQTVPVSQGMRLPAAILPHRAAAAMRRQRLDIHRHGTDLVASQETAHARFQSRADRTIDHR